ncbi:hypothetical protein ALC53_12124 [Atta colombica]|uniref:Uncharacterized protein n=1 Tax=Atta colombica TaxID=520822 RepID=A0A195AZN4_9HYME|nr:hypothetical protein ALC53_12124 [Atta colombica]
MSVSPGTEVSEETPEISRESGTIVESQVSLEGDFGHSIRPFCKISFDVLTASEQICIFETGFSFFKTVGRSMLSGSSILMDFNSIRLSEQSLLSARYNSSGIDRRCSKKGSRLSSLSLPIFLLRLFRLSIKLAADSSNSFLFTPRSFSMNISSFNSLTCCNTTGSSSGIAVTRFKVTPPSAAESESFSSLSSISLSLVSESSFTTNTLENLCELESSSRSLLSADDLPDELSESSREC